MAIALITGASSGIGEHFAYALAREQYDLILVARRDDRLQSVAQEAARRGAPRADVIVADLTDHTTREQVFNEVSSRHGALDLLINNAGFGTQGRFANASVERVEREIELNAVAAVALTRLFLPAMLTRGCGQIINVASTSSFQPVPFMAVYGATKAFLLSFSLALAAETAGTGVKVMALCPGLTRTEFQAVAGSARPWIPDFAYMEPQTVVAQALRAARRGKAYYINGRLNAAAAQMVRFMPRSLVNGAIKWVFREQP
jgi:short-subunit dehydrogenase